MNLIVVHCSASPNGASLFEGRFGQKNFRTPAEVIDDWHRDRGFRRDMQWRARMNEPLTAIGYHFLIYTAGISVTGRHMGEVGAHVVGNNRRSIGICMIGTDRFTPAQWTCLAGVITALRESFPRARVCGHRDLSPDQDSDGLVEPWEWLKICPGFDVGAWLERDMTPAPENVFEAPVKDAA